MICQLPCHPCLPGSPPTTHHHPPKARPLRPNYCSACVSVCLCKKQGSAGQKGKIEEEAPWKDWKRPASPRPVGKSSSLGRDQQPSLVCYSTFCDRVSPLLSRSREEAKTRSSVAGPSKHGMNRSGTLSPSPLPSTFCSNIVIFPRLLGRPGGIAGDPHSAAGLSRSEV